MMFRDDFMKYRSRYSYNLSYNLLDKDDGEDKKTPKTVKDIFICRWVKSSHNQTTGDFTVEVSENRGPEVSRLVPVTYSLIIPSDYVVRNIENNVNCGRFGACAIVSKLERYLIDLVNQDKKEYWLDRDKTTGAVVVKSAFAHKVDRAAKISAIINALKSWGNYDKYYMQIISENINEHIVEPNAKWDSPITFRLS